MGSLAKEVNEVHVEGYDYYGNSGMKFFVIPDDTEDKLPDASNIAVNDELLKNPMKIAASSIGINISSHLGVVDPDPDETELSSDSEYRIVVTQNDDNQIYLQLQKKEENNWKDVGDKMDFYDDTGSNITIGTSPEEGEEGEFITFTLAETPPPPGNYTVNFTAPGNGKNALRVAELRHKGIDNSENDGLDGATIDDFYRNLVSGLGVSTHEAHRMVENQGVLVDQIDARRESISGVSIDEEMANMITYMHAYQAAARYIDTMDQLLDTLINRMAW